MSDKPQISRSAAAKSQETRSKSNDRVLLDRGNVPNMFRTMAHRPQISKPSSLIWTRCSRQALSRLLLRNSSSFVRTSQLNRTPYCLASHSALARRLGWTEDQLAALFDAATSPLFSDSEKAAIHLAEVMTSDPHGYTEIELSQLRSFYFEGEIVELMAAIGLFNYFNRFNDLLQMEKTQPATAEELAQLAAI